MEVNVNELKFREPFGPAQLFYRRTLGQVYPVKVSMEMLGPFLAPGGNRSDAPHIVAQYTIRPEHQDLSLDMLVVLYPLPRKALDMAS